MAAINSLVTKILKDIFFCAQQKNETHTDFAKHEVE